MHLQSYLMRAMSINIFRDCLPELKFLVVCIFLGSQAVTSAQAYIGKNYKQNGGYSQQAM